MKVLKAIRALGLFSDIKSKLRAHRGISKDNRKKNIL